MQWNEESLHALRVICRFLLGYELCHCGDELDGLRRHMLKAHDVPDFVKQRLEELRARNIDIAKDQPDRLLCTIQVEHPLRNDHSGNPEDDAITETATQTIVEHLKDAMQARGGNEAVEPAASESADGV